MPEISFLNVMHDQVAPTVGHEQVPVNAAFAQGRHYVFVWVGVEIVVGKMADTQEGAVAVFVIFRFDP